MLKFFFVEKVVVIRMLFKKHAQNFTFLISLFLGLNLSTP